MKPSGASSLYVVARLAWVTMIGSEVDCWVSSAVWRICSDEDVANRIIPRPGPCSSRRCGAIEQGISVSRYQLAVTLDQVVSSLTNLALSVLVARSLTQEGFGEFAVGFAIVTLAIGFARSMGSETFALARPVMTSISPASSVAASIAAGFAATSVLVILVYAVVPAARGAALITLLVSAAIVGQDGLRTAFIVAREPGRAVAVDAAQGVLVAIGLTLVPWTQADQAIAIWGVASLLSVLAVGIASRSCLRVGALVSPGRWLREHWATARSLAGEYVVNGASGQVISLMVPALLGLQASAALRAAQVIVAPANVLLMAMAAFVLPEGARIEAEDGARLTSFLKRQWMQLSVAILVWGTAVQVIPDSVGTALLGSSWSDGHALSMYVLAGVLAICCAIPGRVGLRVRGFSNVSFRIRLMIAPIGLAAATIAALTGNLRLVIASEAVTFALGAAWWWLAYRRRSSHRTEGIG
jgi:O-antigen/teichoic acid export membrane protein